MEKRKWLWKSKSSDKSPGGTDSSGSMSSHSERYSDDMVACKSSPNHDSESPEVSSEVVASGEDVDFQLSKKDTNDTVRSLTERLSAALVNISAKEDLVKQHEKVAEEAIAGWEQAENEARVLKQQLGAAVQQKSALEDRASHLDGALKECVRQLRQSREEHEQRICEALEEKSQEWESTKLELERQLLELRTKSEDFNYKSLKKENSTLKLELHRKSEELEIRTIERDLSTQTAEIASKQHLESIKKVAKLEAECRRLKVMSKSNVASSVYLESLTDSQSDSGERLITMDVDTCKISNLDQNQFEEPSCTDTWASALIAELDQFKVGKTNDRNIPNPSLEIDLMDDFLEMERLAALPEPEPRSHQAFNEENSLKAELEAFIIQRAEMEEKMKKMEEENFELVEKVEKLEMEKAQLEDKLKKMGEEAAELENDLIKSEDLLNGMQIRLKETEDKLEELQKELSVAKESKQVFESQLIGLEAEAHIMSAKVGSLEAAVQKERASSVEFAVKYRELEEELSKKEEMLRQNTSSNGEMKIKQEDLAVAAGKLAECQKTIASLGNQLKSLATLEDFLIDTTNIPKLSATPSKTNVEQWRLHSNGTFSPKRDSGSLRMAGEGTTTDPSITKNEDNSPPSSSSSSNSSAAVSTYTSSEKSRNGFAKFFTRTKSGIRLEI